MIISNVQNTPRITKISTSIDSYVCQIPPSGTLLINEQSRRLESEGKRVYKLGFGQSPFSPPESIVEELKRYAHCHDYLPVQGDPELRETITRFYKRIEGLDIKADNVIVGPGSKILIMTILKAFNTADVIIPLPSWVSYEPQARLAGHRVLGIKTSFETSWKITPEALEACCQSRGDQSKPVLLILNTPGNPIGMSYSESELRAISEVARVNGIIVISDEIYGLLSHGAATKSLYHYYPEGTLITSGLSKWCGVGGWRLGVLVIPPSLGKRFKHSILGIASETYSSAPTPIQYAAIKAYQFEQEMAVFVQKERALLSALGARCATMLSNNDVRIHPPDGAFYLFPDFSQFQESLARQGILTSNDLCEALFEATQVALLPGTCFGMPEKSLTARLAYVDFDGTAAIKALDEQGVDHVDQVMSETGGKVIDGVQRIIDWLAQLS